MSGERMPFPTNLDVILSQIEHHAEDTFVALPGTIQSYDPATQRADVVVGVRNPYADPGGSGQQLREDFPVIPHVRVLFPRMGSWFLAMSVQPGDAVQILVNTLTPEDWMTGNGEVRDVGDTRRQHLAHAVALLGMEVNPKALRHAPPAVAPTAATACLTLGSDLDAGTRLSIYGDGSVKITQGATVVAQIDVDGTVHIGGAAGDFVALAGLVKGNFDALKAIFTAWTPVPNDGGAVLKTALGGWTVAEMRATKAKAV